MGVDDEMWKCRVEDEGMKFVYADDRAAAAFPVEQSGGLVKELEILRPDVARVLFGRTEGRVEYLFEDWITAIDQGEEGARVRFANSGKQRTFDIVVAADGLRSKTRDVAFDASNTEIVSFKQYAGFFSIPWEESDGTWSRWYNAPGGLCVALRPRVKSGVTGAYLCQVTDDSEEVAVLPHDQQVKEVIKRFRNAGWETGRVLRRLEEDDSMFYLTGIAQVKCKSLVNGRVGLLGDAGYCSSPISGQSATLSLIGAYILAGCIATHTDYRKALEEYEKQVRPFVDRAQKLPPGVPWIVNPQSSLGISVLSTLR